MSEEVYETIQGYDEDEVKGTFGKHSLVHWEFRREGSAVAAYVPGTSLVREAGFRVFFLLRSTF